MIKNQKISSEKYPTYFVHKYDKIECLDMISLKNYILGEYPLLVKYFKNGDIIEDLSQTGYRSNGTYFIKKENDSDFEIIERSFNIDSYGSSPSCFTPLHIYILILKIAI